MSKKGWCVANIQLMDESDQCVSTCWPLLFKRWRNGEHGAAGGGGRGGGGARILLWYHEIYKNCQKLKWGIKFLILKNLKMMRSPIKESKIDNRENRHEFLIGDCLFSLYFKMVYRNSLAASGVFSWGSGRRELTTKKMRRAVFPPFFMILAEMYKGQRRRKTCNTGVGFVTWVQKNSKY